MIGRLPLLVLGALFACVLLLAGVREAHAAAKTLNLDTTDGTQWTAVPADVVDDDPKRPLSITEVADPAFASRFKPLPHGGIVEPFRSGWIRFSLNTKAPPEAWLLAVDLQFSDADLYVPNGHGGYGLIRFGEAVPYRDRSWPNLQPAVVVTRAMASGTPLYLHFSEQLGEGAQIWVTTQVNVLSGEASNAGRSWLLIGITLAICIVNVLLFVYLRELAFLMYGLVMILFIFSLLVYSGLAWAALWPWASVKYVWPVSISNAAVFPLIALFANSFLELPKRAPRAAAIQLWIAVLAALTNSVTSLIWWQLPAWSLLLPPGIFYAVLLVLGIRLQRTGFRAARFYVIGFAGFAFFWFVGNLNTLAILDLSWLPWLLQDVVSLGFVWEAIFVTFAIVDQFRLSRVAAFDALAARQAALEEVASTQKQMLDRVQAQNASMERFVPRPFLELLERDSVEALQLGDHTLREMTLLFSDIRSFTTLAESMSPDDTFAFVNSYFAHTGPVIRSHQGFIDKYIGDALFALFPGTAQDGVEAAIDLQLEVTRYNQERARAGYAPIAIGVGLHRGHLALGAIGERERIETTVIADAVNVASRMEGLTKLFGARIVVSEAVVGALEEPERYRIRPLGHVQVKGTTQGVVIFEVFDADSPELIVSKLGSREVFAEAIAIFGAGHFEEAGRLFARLSSESPADRPAAHFAQRCKDLMDLPAGIIWDGIERLESK